MIDNNILLPNVSSPQSINPSPSKERGQRVNEGVKSFESYLKEAEQTNKENELKFSAHALSRLSSRNINMTAEDMKRLSVAADKALQKGGRDTLVLLNGSGFIVDNRSKTVVTALDLNSMKEQVFTNIDTAVVG